MENKLHLLPSKSAGVQGAGGTYDYVCAIRGKPDFPLMELMAKNITKFPHQINRVVYFFDKNNQEIKKINVTKTYLLEDAIIQLRKAD